MTRKLNFIAAFLLAVTLALAAGGVAEAKSINATFWVGRDFYVFTDSTGEVQGNNPTMDVVPFIENDRAYVPVRYLAYALGVAEKDVAWDDETQTVTLRMDGTTLELKVGDKTLYVDGKPQVMDVTPLLRDGRVFLPARFVAEAFGYHVLWNDIMQHIKIYLS
ncbi:copper amine oxidase-like protein [Moorella sp. E308F]|uniref:copper amine oxidase N-terminal domain-containing protein n=1 Tax=unclassified Neomoorella TaxID=2676739 RepID=UPI0010FFC2B6|nr:MULTISPECIES: copper amine oxidase N-terminal domain-containing protein [unclassified Moorella (in: firmicutes)]GEA15431.1 copper amine oxidase-like protein [Moorella sp. E308F]GEA19709.1 copper amine oxidase-like protein [Moorella sp. E306M]